MASVRQITLDEVMRGTEGDRGPLLEYKWIIDSFPEIEGKETLPISYCEEVSLPFPQISEKQFTIAATNIMFPGASQIQAFDITVYEDQKARTLDYFLGWQSIVQNPYSGGFYPATFFKKDLKVYLLNNKNIPIYQALIRNVWPMGIQNLSLNYTGEDRVRLNVNMACDSFIPTRL